VVLDPGNKAARLVIPASLDPRTVTAGALMALARTNGVEITTEVAHALTKIAESFAAAPFAIDQVFAKATPPVPGTDASIEWSPGCDPENPAGPQPAENDQGRIDHYARQCFVRVHANQCVATVRPATAGTEGRDVTGRALPATPGAPLGLVIDPSLKLDPDGSLIAQRDGRLHLEASKLWVDPVLEVKGTVDFHTGNIDFNGDVNIQHDIRDRFQVKAVGRLTVHGLVDACHLECARDLVAPRGIAGRGEGTIKVGGDALVGYLDQLSGHVNQSLHFRKSIRRCRLTIGGGLIGECGVVIGGRLVVGAAVRVAELGTASETPTEIQLSTPPGVPLSSERTVHVLRVVHPMVTLIFGETSMTFTDRVPGPVRFWLGVKGLMFRCGEREARPIRELAGVTSRAGA
jgi:uncharacterized protein (DUF342 family)